MSPTFGLLNCKESRPPGSLQMPLYTASVSVPMILSAVNEIKQEARR